MTTETADQIPSSKSQLTNLSAKYKQKRLSLNFAYNHPINCLPLNMSSVSSFVTRKKWEYVEASLFGSSPNTAGIFEPCGSVAIRMNTWRNGAGQEANVPSTEMIEARRKTSMPASLAYTSINLSGLPSTGPLYLQLFLNFNFLF